MTPDSRHLQPTGHDHQAILEAHLAAVDAGEAGYADPSTGLFVLTATYLRLRGYCCGNECRHCPYGGPTDPDCGGNPSSLAGHHERRGAWWVVPSRVRIVNAEVLRDVTVPDDPHTEPR
jgi:hypothetical protein